MRLPFAGCATKSNDNASPSASAPVSTIDTEVSCGNETAWAFATGALLTGGGGITPETVIDTVAGALFVIPSPTVKVKLSTPVKSLSEV